MCDHLQNRNIVVTGGTRGLGLLQVEHALRCGASHVTFTNRPESMGGNSEDAQKAVERLEAEFDSSRFSHVEADVRVACDGSNDDVCNGRVFDPNMRESLGLPRRVDSASLNAGVFGPGDVSRRLDVIENHHWDNIMDTNCKGVFHGIRDFANAQKEEPSSNPSVVVIKSIYGSGASLFGNAPYHASKFCAHGVMKQAAIEYARPERGIPKIQVNSVSPGFSKTPLTKGFWHIEDVRDEIANAHPTGEWVEGEDVASTVGWLLNPPNPLLASMCPWTTAQWLRVCPGGALPIKFVR